MSVAVEAAGMVCSAAHDDGAAWMGAMQPRLCSSHRQAQYFGCRRPAPWVAPTSRPCSMHQSHLHSEMARLEREMAAKEHALLSMSQHAALKQK